VCVSVCVCKNTRCIQQAIATILQLKPAASVGFHEISSGVGKNYPTHRSILEIVQWVSVAAVSRKHAHTFTQLCHGSASAEDPTTKRNFTTIIWLKCRRRLVYTMCTIIAVATRCSSVSTPTYNTLFTIVNVTNYIDLVVVGSGTNRK